MVDPLTLSALGATALTEGIKFLYEQATELLRRRRENQAEQEPAVVEAPVLEGALAPLRPDPAVLARFEDDLRRLRRELQDYVDDVEPIEPGDTGLLEKADAVRQMLEVVYGQRITFRGERRPASGPLVEGEVEVATVAGRVAAVRAKQVTGPSTIRGVVRVDDVTDSGEVVGVDIDRIGDR